MLIDLVGAVHRQHEAVGFPVCEEIRHGSDQEGNQGAARSANKVADLHEQGH
jgi:hypothetical protein